MDQYDQTNSANASGQTDDVDLPSINADRTPAYQDPLVNQAAHNTYGAKESEVNRDQGVIAPTFSDTEPGAGNNYGAAGDPDAPNLGGREDQTTLGPNSVRPPDSNLVCEGEFETRSASGAASSEASSPQRDRSADEMGR